jgi:hypothetical protein
LDASLLIFFMELVSSVISFIVGYFALRAYKTTGSKGLLLLYLGFLVLGIGIFLRFVTATYVGMILRFTSTLGHPRLTRLVNLTALIYMGTQLVAYGLFTATYALQAAHTSARTVETGVVAAAAAPLVAKLFFIPQLELVAITLLGFITVYTFTNWLLKRGTGAALVFLGFGLMLLSHLFFLLIIVEDLSLVFLVLGQTTQLAGFICLLTMLAKVSKTNA